MNDMKFIYIAAGIIILFVGLAVFGRSRSTPSPQNLSEEDILKAAQSGQKIQAIKWYRTLHGVGLKDAKEAVEKMIR